MRKLSLVKGKIFPINRSNIDTDQICPARWLKRVEMTGYQDALFENLRKDPNFVFNDPARDGAKIILAGSDFGIGSSREHAVWAMRDFGIEAVIAPSIGDIHRNNLPSGPVVPVIISYEDWSLLMKTALNNPDLELTIDVANKTITGSDGFTCGFNIDSAAQNKLVNGLDDIEITLKYQKAIKDYESTRYSWLPKIIT